MTNTFAVGDSINKTGTTTEANALVVVKVWANSILVRSFAGYEFKIDQSALDQYQTVEVEQPTVKLSENMSRKYDALMAAKRAARA